MGGFAAQPRLPPRARGLLRTRCVPDGPSFAALLDSLRPTHVQVRLGLGLGVQNPTRRREFPVVAGPLGPHRVQRASALDARQRAAWKGAKRFLCVSKCG
jgi:hypothetical protein